MVSCYTEGIFLSFPLFKWPERLEQALICSLFPFVQLVSAILMLTSIQNCERIRIRFGIIFWILGMLIGFLYLDYAIYILVESFSLLCAYSKPWLGKILGKSSFSLQSAMGLRIVWVVNLISICKSWRYMSFWICDSFLQWQLQIAFSWVSML